MADLYWGKRFTSRRVLRRNVQSVRSTNQLYLLWTLKAVSGQKLDFEILCLPEPIRYAESENHHWRERKRRKRALRQKGTQQRAGSSAGRIHAPSLWSDLLASNFKSRVCTSPVAILGVIIGTKKSLRKLGA